MVPSFYGATVDAQRTINKLLLLPASGREQDWEIELADPERIGDMLELAERSDLSYDERCALALLTIASIEELMEEKEVPPGIIAKAKEAISRCSRVREAMIFYWIEQRRSENTVLLGEIIS